MSTTTISYSRPFHILHPFSIEKKETYTGEGESPVGAETVSPVIIETRQKVASVVLGIIAFAAVSGTIALLVYFGPMHFSAIGTFSYAIAAPPGFVAGVITFYAISYKHKNALLATKMRENSEFIIPEPSGTTSTGLNSASHNKSTSSDESISSDDEKDSASNPTPQTPPVKEPETSDKPTDASLPPPPVKQAQPIVDPSKAGSTLPEVWDFHNQISEIAKGSMLKIKLDFPAMVHHTFDNWTTEKDVNTEENFGVNIADLDTGGLPSGTKITFTYQWRNPKSGTNGWVGRNYDVTIK